MLEIILVPALIMITCITMGLILERKIIPYFVSITEKSTIMLDDTIVKSFRGMGFLWCILTGGYFSLLSATDDPVWLSNGRKILVSMAIISVSIIISRIATGVVRAYSKKVEGVLPTSSIFSNLTRLLVYILGILILLQYLGISITPILTALGVGGLAVALALQETLSNIFAGLQILLSRQLKIGDFIRLDTGEEGFIMDISWRNTSIRTVSNSMVLIPNSKLSDVVVMNHDLPGRETAVIVKVGVSYNSDLDHVEAVTLEVAEKIMAEAPGGVLGFKPLVRYDQFSDSSINFNVILRARSYAEQYVIRHEFIKCLHKRFQAEGIEIPYPISTVHLVQ